MFSIQNYKKLLKPILSEGICSIYEYTPSVLKPLAVPLEHLSLVRRIRFLLEYLRGGYKVYYLAIDGGVVGYCVITPGGRRLKRTTGHDIVIGPYFICPEYRGKGYGKIIVEFSLKHCSYTYDKAYDWIHESNIPSIKCMESCGFKHVGNLDVVGRLRKLMYNSNGAYRVYMRPKT